MARKRERTEIEELLSAWLDGQISPADRERLQKALEADPSLRSLLEDLERTVGLLRSFPSEPAPAHLRERVLRQLERRALLSAAEPPVQAAGRTKRFGLVAAVLVMAVGAGWWIYRAARQEPVRLAQGPAVEAVPGQIPAPEVGPQGAALPQQPQAEPQGSETLERAVPEKAVAAGDGGGGAQQEVIGPPPRESAGARRAAGPSDRSPQLALKAAAPEPSPKESLVAEKRAAESDQPAGRPAQRQGEPESALAGAWRGRGGFLISARTIAARARAAVPVRRDVLIVRVRPVRQTPAEAVLDAMVKAVAGSGWPAASWYRTGHRQVVLFLPVGAVEDLLDLLAELDGVRSVRSVWVPEEDPRVQEAAVAVARAALRQFVARLKSAAGQVVAAGSTKRQEVATGEVAAAPSSGRARLQAARPSRLLSADAARKAGRPAIAAGGRIDIASRRRYAGPLVAVVIKVEAAGRSGGVSSDLPQRTP